MKNFNIPIVLFMFKRKETLLRIIERMEEIQPQKIYLIADSGRNEIENRMVDECRRAVEAAISWDCEIIKNYAEENRGVYENIGEGAKWVFEKEKKAIFLEDDNLPEVSFFYYCEELLEKYEEEPKVLWICGTNYLGRYHTDQKVSYMFTQHLLPCGWASWSNKFLKFYDGEMTSFSQPGIKEIIKKSYNNRKLYKYQYRLFEKTYYKLEHDRKSCSWDYQMAYSLRYNDLYGISPVNNQIKNIGVDEFSEHGGTSLKKTMTKRFCGMESYLLEIPLNHPCEIKIDQRYEKMIGNIITPPWNTKFILWGGDVIKKIIGLDKNASLVAYIKKKYRK